MKLIGQILNELGADGLNGIVLYPGACCYVKSVKSVSDFSPKKIVLRAGGKSVSIEGENMQIGEYFEGDILIKGGVMAVRIE